MAVTMLMNFVFIFLMYRHLSYIQPVFELQHKFRAHCTKLIPEQKFLFCFRTGLLFSTMFTTGMGFMSALSPNYLCLMVLRFLVGIGLGGGHVFSSWFLEFVPAQNRGTWMIVFSFFWTVGTILEASLAWVLD